MVRKIVKTLLDKTEIDEKIIGASGKVKKEIRKHIITAVLAAFGFLIALSWRDAIQAVINDLLFKFNLTQESYIFKFVAAIIITIFSVAGIIFFAKFEEKD
jgi:uncharacterized membrane protein YjgN (DUF898 family)